MHQNRSFSCPGKLRVGLLLLPGPAPYGPCYGGPEPFALLCVAHASLPLP